MRMTSFVAGMLCSAIVWPALQAPNAGFTPRPDADRIPSYELVSIHKTADPNTARDIHDDPDGFTARAATLRSLIGEAYGFALGELTEQQLLGAPAWAKTQTFDIKAKVDSANVDRVSELTKAETMMVSVKQIVSRTPSFRMVMLQRLLETAFNSSCTTSRR